MKRNILVVFFLLLFAYSDAQFTRYLVQFKDKGNNPYSIANPSAYLSQRAIERREKYAVAVDSTDLPVSPSYIARIAAIPNVEILTISRWLNQVCIKTNDAAAVSAITVLPFVQTISGIAARKANRYSWYDEEITEEIPFYGNRSANATSNHYEYGSVALNEMHLHNGEFLHNAGLRGESMQIAIIDAGFYKYNTFKAFDSINAKGLVLDTWDFVAGESSVSEDNSHGMSCFSTIAANIPGQFVGTAPEAGFYLFRSEDASSEYPIEEHNWVCAAERADSSGADVISSSLGYTSFDISSLSHPYSDLDGNTTIAAKGADLAAKKGLLVVIAAGNEGNKSWRYIMTPADADSVLTVGAVNINGVKGNFSSYGPSADGRIKPDVMAVGAPGVIQSSANTVTAGSGTSYAAPKMAGLATCLWQAFPEATNMQIIETLRESGSAADNPTDSIGYGIPDMKKAFSILLKKYVSAALTINNCTATLNWSSRDVSIMKYEIERKAPGETDYSMIKEIPADKAVSLTVHAYEFSDVLSGISAGTLSYRIKQIIDTTATITDEVYLDTISYALTSDCNSSSTTSNDLKIMVKPNPVISDEILLDIESPFPIPSLIINLYDNSGKLLLQQKSIQNEGKSTYHFSSNKLATGKYIIAIYNDKKQIAIKEIIKL